MPVLEDAIILLDLHRDQLDPLVGRVLQMAPLDQCVDRFHFSDLVGRGAVHKHPKKEGQSVKGDCFGTQILRVSQNAQIRKVAPVHVKDMVS